MRIWACILSAVGCFAASTSVQAQKPTYPNRPITLVLGLSAGGAVDIVSRLYADKLTQIVGQPVIVENRGGGGGIPAAVAVKQAQPDGYTLMVLLGALHTIAPALQQLPFNPVTDFTPITPFYTAPGYVVVPSKRNLQSVKELVAYGRSKPDGLSYGSPSSGSPAHLMGLLFQEVTGVKMSHIPYRGGGQMMTDFLAGQLDVGFPSYTNIKSSLGPDHLRALAIAAPKRWEKTPDIPTLTEEGYAGIDVENVFGIAGPPGIPKDIVMFLNNAFQKASSDPDLRAKLDDLGAIPIPDNPEALIKFINSDTARFATIIKKYGISQ